MKAYITTCCKEKSKILGEIPMLERYISNRIQSIYQKSKEDDVAFFVLSGKYGLLSPVNKIPWYDKILEKQDLELVTKKVRHQLTIYGITEITFFAKSEWVNYKKCVEDASCQKDIKFNFIDLK